jgi:hypothetical protein
MGTTTSSPSRASARSTETSGPTPNVAAGRGPGEHRPYDHEYWTEPWSATLFAGDLFAAIPFGDQPTVIYAGEEESVAGKHFVGEVAFGYGLLIRRRAI